MRLFCFRGFTLSSRCAPPDRYRATSCGLRSHRYFYGAARASAARASTALGIERFAGRAVFRGAISGVGVVEFPVRATDTAIWLSAGFYKWSGAHGCGSSVLLARILAVGAARC